MKKTKIICTIGPASFSVKKLTAMVKAGMNVARLNFSHGDHEWHAQAIKNIRIVSKRLKTPITIIQDLHGPKIRVSEMDEPLRVKIGQQVVIGKDFTLNTDISKSILPKQKILIEDGLIEMEVEKIDGKNIHCIMLGKGKIKARKGVNVPRAKLKIPTLTDDDIKDLRFCLKLDIDYVAVSFVRRKQDIIRLRELIEKYNPKEFALPKIIAKIEQSEAVKDFDHILQESDSIMVARGDLGVEISESQVPIIQKLIIQKCLKSAKPVIVATQMLDSMIKNPRPTRAEVSDVANAVIDQTDCVMLSGESAFGKYPVRSVSQMAKIIEETEKSEFIPKHQYTTQKNISRTDAIAESAFDLALQTKAKVIVGATESGFTARQIAQERPYHSRIVMLTPEEKTLNQINMVWGIEGFLVSKFTDFEELMKEMTSLLRRKKIVKKGDRVVIVTGEPLGQRENLNLIEVKTV